MTGRSTAGLRVLDLRVDIDVRYANSPVMNRISGDFYAQYRFNLPGRGGFSWRVYRESWIIDAPTVNWSFCEVEITGTARFWHGTHPPTTVVVRIPWANFSPVGPAQVTFTQTGTTNQTYSCTRRSDAFRDVNLEVDVVQSVNAGQIVPTYASDSHPTRPTDLPQRTLTIEESFREAGVRLTIRPARSILIDIAPGFTSWSPAELHDAMETHFSQIGGTWPRWELWGLLAGQFDNAGVGGIMFDAAAAFGGAGEAPERQGFAVFRNHPWFSNLPAGAPNNTAEADALRKYLYTWVHEAGHAFNFLHSWNKNRPDSLSWMNYDWRYDNRNGANSFWSNFYLRFDDEELIHIRHGDRASVVMGGDPWGSGGHMEAPPGAEYLWAPPGALSQAEGDVPLELQIESKDYFDFLEPVTVQLTLRNLLPDLPLEVDTRLNPEYGGMIIYIRRPDGRTVEYAPIMCKLADPLYRTLSPGTARARSDSYSESIYLSYGQYGFYFDKPGEYLIRALYQGGGDLLIPSNTHRLRVGYPASKEEDKLAQDVFSYPVGISTYLGGSPSPHLERGMDVLEDLVGRYPDTLVGAKAAIVVGNAVSQSFYRIKPESNTLVRMQAGDPEATKDVAKAALGRKGRGKQALTSLASHALASTRTAWLSAGEEGDSLAGLRAEAVSMRDDMSAQGISSEVLDELNAFASAIAADK